MTTTITIKRVQAITKGLVTLSKVLTTEHSSSKQLCFAGALSVGAFALSNYYVKPWFTGSSKTLRDVLEGNCNGELQDSLTQEAGTLRITDGSVEGVDGKRRIRAHCRELYQREIVGAVKAKFGVPAKTEANLRAVRRFATEKMRGDNVRHTNIQRIMPLIIAASFVPDKYEIEAMKVANCSLAVGRQLEYGLLKRSAGFASG